MGRCCNLSTRSTCRNPRAHCTHRHRTAVHLLYPIPYASIYIQYIVLPPPTCFSVPTPLTPVIVTLSAHHLTHTQPHTLHEHTYTIHPIPTTDMFSCSYSPYPCNSNPISTVYN